MKRRFSYLAGLHCPACSLQFSPDRVHHLCQCGSPLLVDYDLAALKKNWRKEDLASRVPSLWRYHELLPVLAEENAVTLGEGMTPLLPLENAGQDMGIGTLLMKDEGVIPTGSFKARGAAVGVSKAKELGAATLAMPTNGNAGAAWSLYAARAGLPALIVMPEEAPDITKKECAISGAELYLVDGLISDAGAIVGEAVRRHGLYDASTLKEPYRIEGKKTMGLEIAEQLGWQVPDVILYPTGGGVGLIGIYKAFQELQALSWIDSGKMPRFVAVQAGGCAPIVKAWEERASRSEFWEDSSTAAFGINVPKAIGDFLVLEALYATGGCAIAVRDGEMLAEQRFIAKNEGAFICPEGAAAFSAARKLRKSGWITAGETVVVLNTGTGLKYPDTVSADYEFIKKREKI